MNSEFSINNYLVDLIQKSVKNENDQNIEITEEPDNEDGIVRSETDESSQSTSPTAINFKIKFPDHPMTDCNNDEEQTEHVDDEDGRRVDNELRTPFYCRHCPKSFPYLSHLRKHEIIHFDEKL